MNKTTCQGLILIGFGLGLLISTSSRLLFRDHLSDFAKGFCEGVSFVLILTGLVYFVWCAFHQKNPYKFEKKDDLN